MALPDEPSAMVQVEEGPPIPKNPISIHIGWVGMEGVARRGKAEIVFVVGAICPETEDYRHREITGEAFGTG